jgi:hypothetical protein
MTDDPILPPLSALHGLRRWTAWQTEQPSDRKRPTKIPYRAPGIKSQADNPNSWLTFAEATAAAGSLERPLGTGGVGIYLGDLGNGWSLAGIDYDSCIGAGGIEAWALAGMSLCPGFTEMSPSGTGIKQFACYPTADLGAIRTALGMQASGTGRQWKRRNADGSTVRHAPGMEIYVERRFFAVTGEALYPERMTLGFMNAGRFAAMAREVPPMLTGIEAAAPAIAGETTTDAAAGAGAFSESRPAISNGNTGTSSASITDALSRDPALAQLWSGDTSGLGVDRSRSAVAFRLAMLLKRSGVDEDEARSALSTHPMTAEWMSENLGASGGRQWQRAWERAPTGPEEVTMDALPTVAGLSSIDPRPIGASDGFMRADCGRRSNPDGRPVIQVKAGHLAETADMAEQALLAAGVPVYVRGGSLVTPTAHTVRTRGGANAIAVGLQTLGPAALRDLLSRCADWCRWDARAKRLVACDPPTEVVAVLLERPAPRAFPSVVGVVSTPVMREDGSIASGAGFDRGTWLHRIADDGLRMPDGWNERPAVRSDAVLGAALLDGLLAGFPFVAQEDRSVGLALLLTAVCRGSVPLAPIFAVSATDAGSGKSHLIDLASAIATGRRAPAASVGDSPEEFDKRLVGLIAAGYPIVSIDNVNGTIRSDVLNQAVERDTIRLRLLGSSAIIEIESRALFAANGNGLRLSGDLVRRTLPCRLDAAVERPETRTFTFDPVRTVEADRGPYVAAALTVLAAHAAAGFPGARGLPPIGSYEEWSRHVRGAMVWLGYDDPGEAMERARRDDPDLRLLRDMLSGWVSRFGTDKTCTVKEAVDVTLSGAAGMGALAAVADGAAEEAVNRSSFMDAMLRAGGVRGAVDSAKLGRWLTANAGRVVGGMRFVNGGADRTKTMLWQVTRVRPDLRLVT